jgi:hypothetical protein
MPAGGKEPSLMRKLIVPALSILLLLGVSMPAGAEAVPRQAHARGHSVVEWQRLFIDWLTTSSDNVLVNGGCGDIVDGVYFLPVASGPDSRAECHVPAGTWLLASPTGGFSEIPTWGADDDAVLADLRGSMSQLIFATTTVDGHDLSGSVMEAGVYDVGPVESGSFFDLECEELPAPCSVDFQPGETVRLASAAEVLMLHPLPPGTHTIVMRAQFTFTPDPIEIVVTLHVG